ncbi:MAG TPA: hypothetical protein VFS44_02845 [Gemmatimonadaceae bacterium]|nr:hypothetical protein [Gemmatimonadaceae bacterium]
MLSWLVAVVGGVVIAVGMYGWREPRMLARRAPLVALRAIAVMLLIALALDAPSGARHPLPPLVALDASTSWLRDGDTALWRRARDRARSFRDSVFLFGDSVRAAAPPRLPGDAASRARPLAERALGAGRPLVLITDGELDDPSALPTFPAGSRIEVLQRPPVRDVAVATLDAPRAVVSGDTLEVRVGLRAGALPVPAGTLAVAAGGRTLITRPVSPLPARAERTETVRVPFAGAPGATVLSAIVRATGDAEPRNDTVSVPLDVARAAGAVLASTSPDFDARFLVPVLRGAVALPTRAYYRVAPGQWRQDGSLAPVAESAVRAALHDAPLAIIHGDTTYFGAPRSATTGSLALVAPPSDSTGEWYAVAAPPSPIAAALSGIRWDSLPPVTISARALSGDWEGITVARVRQFDRRPAIVGTGTGRRVVVVGAAGLWRWQFRGGASADAFAALWGSIFDWLSAERPDPRGAIPAEGVLRAGDPIRWRRGSGTDSVVLAVLRRRGTTRDDTVPLRFGRGGTVAESDPLPAGVYDVRVPGGAAVLAVNASRELLPRAPSVRAGAVGGAVAYGEQPRLRDLGWAYVLLLAALCGEWLLRRRSGLR